MAALGEEVNRIKAAGADWAHVDVMDGQFVPNITVGIPVVEALSKSCQLPLDVHLMINTPENYVEDFAQAGANILTIQAEASLHLYRTVKAIADAGMKVGVALNPASPLSMIEHVLEEIDMVLIMTVEPGFGGQDFIPAMLPKITQLAEIIQNRQLDIDIQVDGGINKDTIGLAARAGANVFVAGTAVFGNSDVKQSIDDLRRAI
jgi:ribulose-phosphate 3-epimerase